MSNTEVKSEEFPDIAELYETTRSKFNDREQVAQEKSREKIVGNFADMEVQGSVTALFCKGFYTTLSDEKKPLFTHEEIIRLLIATLGSG